MHRLRISQISDFFLAQVCVIYLSGSNRPTDYKFSESIETLVMLCYVMLCYAMLMLCYVMLCYVILCYVMLCYVMLCYVMLCYVMLSLASYTQDEEAIVHNRIVRCGETSILIAT